MKRHKIIKGTESDPIIYGLRTDYFYKFFAFLLGGVFLFSFSFMAIGSKNIIILGLFLFGMSRLYFNWKKKSKAPKIKKSKKTRLLSNKNLPKLLK